MLQRCPALLPPLLHSGIKTSVPLSRGGQHWLSPLLSAVFARLSLHRKLQLRCARCGAMVCGLCFPSRWNLSP